MDATEFSYGQREDSANKTKLNTDYQMEKLLSIINTVLENRGKTTVASINADTSLRNDLGLDSLDLAELTVRIESEYDVDIFEDGIVTTIGEIMSKIEDR